MCLLLAVPVPAGAATAVVDGRCKAMKTPEALLALSLRYDESLEADSPLFSGDEIDFNILDEMMAKSDAGELVYMDADDVVEVTATTTLTYTIRNDDGDEVTIEKPYSRFVYADAPDTQLWISSFCLELSYPQAASIAAACLATKTPAQQMQPILGYIKPIAADEGFWGYIKWAIELYSQSWDMADQVQAGEIVPLTKGQSGTIVETKMFREVIAAEESLTETDIEAMEDLLPKIYHRFVYADSPDESLWITNRCLTNI